MDEQTLYGLKAVLALLEKRPQAVLRLFYRADRIPALKGVFAWLAARHLPYRELNEDSLRKVAGSPHHEGVVAVALPLPYEPLPAELPAAGAWVALDGIENPHNLGAILRSAAFLGAAGAIIGGASPGGKVNAAVLRVSEGGAEHLRLIAAPELGAALAAFTLRMPVIGLETGARRALWDVAPIPEFVLAAGNEQKGLSPAVRRVCTSIVTIPGTGYVGSLNVSVAVGIALAHLLPRRR
jgi:TrmH RNA methyltransferase